MVKEFAALADDFERQVREAEISRSTNVLLVIHTIDGDGNPMPAVRYSMTPITTVRGGRDRAAQRSFAEWMHVNTICDNIHAQLKHFTDDLKQYVWFPQRVRIVGFELEFWD
jgi:hypothetical protein